MQVIRTVLWIVLTAVLVAFIAMNWTNAPVNLWPLADGNYLHFEWPVGVVALLFFLVGSVPMWLLHRAARWRMSRRIASLEGSLRAMSGPPAAPASPPAPALPEPPPAAEPAKDPT